MTRGSHTRRGVANTGSEGSEATVDTLDPVAAQHEPTKGNLVSPPDDKPPPAYDGEQAATVDSKFVLVASELPPAYVEDKSAPLGLTLRPKLSPSASKEILEFVAIEKAVNTVELSVRPKHKASLELPAAEKLGADCDPTPEFEWAEKMVREKEVREKKAAVAREYMESVLCTENDSLSEMIAIGQGILGALAFM